MKQVTNQTRTMAQSSSGNIKKVATEMKVLANETKNTTAQQDLLIKKINDMKADLSTLSSLELKGNVGQQLRADIEKAENQLLSLQGKTKTTGSIIDNSFKNGLKSVKRFVLGLVSVGSVYALISRGIQSYLATNEEAQRKYELTSNTIGAMLAPAMEKLLDVIQYIVIGMALLIQMFTGFNALANVTTKNISNATKESKKLNKELTAMDEITNLSDPDAGAIDSGGRGGGRGGFQSKIAEVQALFDKWEIQKVVDKIKDLSKWLWDNKEAVIAVGLAFGTVFALSKMGEIVSNISTLIGVAGTGKLASTGAKGIAGISGMLSALSVIGLITIDIIIWDQVFKDFDELNDTIEDNGGWWKNWKDGVKWYIDDISDLISSLISKIKELSSLQISKIGSSGGGYVGGGGRAFATGGVVTKPTYSLTGEYQNAKNDPEIISPQSMMRDTMLDAFSQILPSMQGNNNGGGDAILVVNGKELARATFQDYQNEGLRVGTSTLIRRS